MRPYIAFSRYGGAPEGAILVFAYTAKEARRLAWQSGECLNVDEWIDLAVRWKRDKSIYALADQEKLQAGLPHIISDPAGCASCGF